MEQFVEIATALVGVVLLVVALGYVARRLNARPLGSGPGLRVISSTWLGPKERLVLVDVLGRRLLVGVSSQHIALLTEVAASAAASADVAGDAAADGPVGGNRV